MQDWLLRLHISKSKRTGKRTCTDLLDASFRKAGGPEKCGQELKKIYETLKTQINPVLCDAQTHPQHIHHSSEIRSLFSTLCPRETLQSFWFLFIFVSFCRQRLCIYYWGKIKLHAMKKEKYMGFLYSKNMIYFKVFLWGIFVEINHLFLKSAAMS